MNNKVSKELRKFREGIDDIDGKIIELLNQRMKIVAEVGKHKKDNNEDFLIRSAREADMIKDLVEKVDKSIPKSTIVSIWRKIITSANVLEQNLKIAVHNPNKIEYYYHMIREYYGDFVPLSNYDSITDIIAKLEKKQLEIAILALSNNNPDQWWINLANNKMGLKVFAKIPFIEYINNDSKDDLFAVAIKSPEKSKDDKTLLVMEVNNKVVASKINGLFKKLSINSKVLQSNSLNQVTDIVSYLVEIEGFFEESDEIIKRITSDKIKSFIKIIGHYPTSIKA